MERNYSWHRPDGQGGCTRTSFEFRIGRAKEYEEAFDEWEVVDVPSQKEMRRFHGTGPPPSNDKAAQDDDRSESELKPLEVGDSQHTIQPEPARTISREILDDIVPPRPLPADQRTTLSRVPEDALPMGFLPIGSTPPQSEAKSRRRDPGPELYACSSCNGYHYNTSCIYLLHWGKWLEYHHNYMSSQPYPFAHNETPVDASEHLVLRQKAEALDEYNELARRPNYVANTRLKADLMTKSSREMWYEEEQYQERVRREQAVARLRVRQLDVKQRLLQLDDDESGEEEDDDFDIAERIQQVRAEFGKNLPRTSTATLAG